MSYGLERAIVTHTWPLSVPALTMTYRSSGAHCVYAEEFFGVALTAADRLLLQRLLNREPGSWNDFIDRFLGVIYHVIHHTAHARSVVLRPEEVEDIAAEILLKLVADDYALLRQFRGRSSLATYLTVVTRRICVRQLAERTAARLRTVEQRQLEAAAAPERESGLEHIEEVQRLLARLPRKTREVVRLYYLEGRSYEEISSKLNIPVNSIGPVLTRAKELLRRRLRAASTGPVPAGQQGPSDAGAGSRPAAPPAPAAESPRPSAPVPTSPAEHRQE